MILSYQVPLDQIDAALDGHAVWLQRQYEAGVFLASGRQVPRVGGVILAAGLDRHDLERRLAEDPFHQHGLAEYTVTEFAPTRTIDGLDVLRT